MTLSIARPKEAQRIGGYAIATGLDRQTAAEVQAIHARDGEASGLAVVLVGKDLANQVYVNRKIEAGGLVCIRSSEHSASPFTSNNAPPADRGSEQINECRPSMPIFVCRSGGGMS
ncbi:hypothetical protein [Sphingomonas turrisvirgatae]|uniref:Tetrahydrofolate dehydrogenase/cyclohydrolase catalytic domain-containing protein n=1 Tax=Sphingomonas turrisvirgatae TaxID=1888892 RepID=A0A1E3LRD1_9SPHN|nr:hypothetical protein [Sphingomonas turrisvirgatae]ODP36254.1 hypothetical protein BFL28_05975 [Sphingomonas turrisvirgatae]